REACARIDRLERPSDPKPKLAGNAYPVTATEVSDVTSGNANTYDVAQPRHVRTHGQEDVDRVREEDPLAAEFSTPSELLNLIQQMAEEPAKPNETDEEAT